MKAERPEPFILPEIRKMIGWQPNERDKKNLRILMADRRQTNFSQLLRDLVEEAAVPTRKRWTENAKRIADLQAAEEQADG